MATLFSRIIDGELPARFVYTDDRCVAFLSINPLRPGHTLVVPRVEIEHWIDLAPEDWQYLTQVARRLGAALQRAYDPTKVGMMLAGLEVPHVHIHLVPIDTEQDLNFANAERNPSDEALDEAAERVRKAIAALQ
jgi:diadenosine tetraphosphate (Ap4A) HIT family hydrolase